MLSCCLVCQCTHLHMKICKKRQLDKKSKMKVNFKILKNCPYYIHEWWVRFLQLLLVLLLSLIVSILRAQLLSPFTKIQISKNQFMCHFSFKARYTFHLGTHFRYSLWINIKSKSWLNSPYFRIFFNFQLLSLNVVMLVVRLSASLTQVKVKIHNTHPPWRFT